MLTSLCGLAPSIDVEALTPRYIVDIGAREPDWGALLNMSGSLLASSLVYRRRGRNLYGRRGGLSRPVHGHRAARRGAAQSLLLFEFSEPENELFE